MAFSKGGSVGLGVDVWISARYVAYLSVQRGYSQWGEVE